MVASCNEPLGIPSFNFIKTQRTQRPPTAPTQRTQRKTSQRARETRPCARVTHVAFPETLHFDQHRVFVAVDEDLGHFEFVAGGLAFHPQRAAAAAEERRVPG